jgi:hypothetical protein
MDHGSSERIPASPLILLAAVVFTLATYFIFRSLWEVAIPIPMVSAVLGLQFAALFLVRSKILTQLGAASLSALIAVAACIGAVFLIFPPVLELRIAGAIGAGSALVFIMSSFVAASRVDPVPASAPEPLIIGDFEDDHGVELIKYGEVQAVDALDAQDLPLHNASGNGESVDRQPFNARAELPHIVEEKLYQFDELPESKLGLSLEAHDIIHPSGSQDPDVESLSKMLDESLPPESEIRPQPELETDPSDEHVVPDNWVEETARIMAYDEPDGEKGGVNVTGAAGEECLEEKPVITESIRGIGMRTRYKVLDAATGEHYGTYYGDEGYSTLDPVSLTGLLSSRLAAGELRITKLDWSNFDEVEIHIKIEEPVHVDLGDAAKSGTHESGVSPGRASGPGMEPVPDSLKTPQEEDPAGEAGKEKTMPAATSSGPRYMIYDRRTMQPMGEYVPEGDRSRIDRLALYRMFPEYNFKTFEIDSIRWETGEVRIFIRGEKKKNPTSKAQSPKK